MQNTFEAMGTSVHIVVPGASAHTMLQIERRIHDLERKWSRFLPSSEISQLNRSRGNAASVSADTYRLIASSVVAYRATDGRFDPTVHDAVRALGYDRSFAVIGKSSVSMLEPDVPGCNLIELDPGTQQVRFPLGVRFDPGGIGKGLAADIAAEEIVSTIPGGGIVNIGGDMRIIGSGPDNTGWTIGLAHGRPESRTIRIADGAVSTSSTRKRSWRRSRSVVHHLIDPATGLNPTTESTDVTTIARTAWWAEAATKPLFVAGGIAAPAHIAYRLVSPTTTVTGGGFDDFVQVAA